MLTCWCHHCRFVFITQCFQIIFIYLYRIKSRRLFRDRYYTTSVDLGAMSSPSNQIGGGPGGNKLAQEIHEEFLTCKICLEPFKCPKCLDCLHTFCEQCIENHVMSECTYKKYSDYREFTCPLCRKRTQLPIGGVKKLPDNFLVSSLGELLVRQRPSKFPFCDICKLLSHKHREASSKCLDCNKLLCRICVDLHKDTKVTKNHSLFDVEIEKDIECKEHKDEVVRFYCEPCDTCICVLCTFNEHKGHEITQFCEAVVKYKTSIQNLLDTCKVRIGKYDKQLETLGRCDSLIKKAEQKIRDVAIQFISEIRSKEKALVDDLHTLYGKELMEYVSRRSDMQVNLDSLKSTCSLTEIVLKGKDIELLLLKKQVEEKLSCLSDIRLQELPTNVSKQIAFIPGTLELGNLEDLDHSDPGKKRPMRSYSANMFQEYHSSRTVDVQTNLNELGPDPNSVNKNTQTDMQPDSSTENESNFSFTVCPVINSVYDDKSISTDKISTSEKAVNTRSRSLHSLTQQLQKEPTDDALDVNGPESQASPGLARRTHHRRRRERQRVDVSVRPTTNCTMLSRSERRQRLMCGSSAEDNYFSADNKDSTPSPPGV